MSAVDEDVNAAGNEALFNVMRVRRDFGQNSLIGFTATDRTVLDEDAFNRVAAADVRLVFGGLYYAEAQLGGSWTRDVATVTDSVQDTRAGSLWKLELDRTGRAWGFNYLLNAIDDQFITRTGFLNRNGIITAHGFNRLSWYGAPGATLETVTSFFGPSVVWVHDAFDAADPLETTANINTTFRFRGGWSTGFEVAHNGVDLPSSDYAQYTVDDGIGGETSYLPLLSVKGMSLSVNASTPTFQRFDANVRGSYGRTAIFQEGGVGHAANVSAGVALRPTTSMRVGLSSSFRSIARARDDSEFAREIIPRLQAEYQPTRALFFRAITQVRSERQAALLDARTGAPLLIDGTPVPGRAANELELELLLSYEPTPGTVAYFGYGSSHADPRCSVITGCNSFRVGELDRVRDGLFVKLAYLFRR